jgi:vacuolar-type H+-ATPase subunit I/STV1
MQRILYKLSLLVGLFLLFMGMIMKFFHYSSSGFSFSKRGDIYRGTLDGNGTLILAGMILLFALWNYKFYLTEKKEKDTKRKKEIQELFLRRRKSGRD